MEDLVLMELRATLLSARGEPKAEGDWPRGVVAHGNLLERFDSGLKEGRSLERVEWETAFPGRGVAVGTQCQQSQHLGITIAVSGALSNKLGECKGKGQERKGS